MKIKDYLFEFEDLSWFPDIIRESMTDYLRYLITAVQFYQPILPKLIEGINYTRSTRIIDLCSGGGGAIEQIQDCLQQQYKRAIQVTLTDKFPNIDAYKLLSGNTKGQIDFSETSVDAADVPVRLKGFRTIFSGFHHFSPSFAKSVLTNAVDARSGIGIFDGGDKNIFSILAILLLHPILFCLFTPFFKPFRFSRLFFTYLIPIIPFCTVWDGIVSIMRLYRPSDLLKMAKEVDNTSYFWEVGRIPCKYGLHVTFLIGYPINKEDLL